MEVGTDEQKARFLPTMASSEIVWAQAWSEPNAGSDMAAIASKAVRDGDEWVINGQKIWASRAVWADWCFGIFRTDPSGRAPSRTHVHPRPARHAGHHRAPDRPTRRRHRLRRDLLRRRPGARREHARRRSTRAGGWRWPPPASSAASRCAARPGSAPPPSASSSCGGRQADPADTALCRRRHRRLDAGRGVPAAHLPDRHGHARGSADRGRGEPQQDLLVRDGRPAARDRPRSARVPRRSGWTATPSGGSTGSCSRCRGRSTPAPTRSSATSSPTVSSPCQRARDEVLLHRRPTPVRRRACAICSRKECPPSAVRAAWDDGTGHSPALWKHLDEMGVLGLLARRGRGRSGRRRYRRRAPLAGAGPGRSSRPVLEHMVAAPLVSPARVEARSSPPTLDVAVRTPRRRRRHDRHPRRRPHRLHGRARSHRSTAAAALLRHGGSVSGGSPSAGATATPARRSPTGWPSPVRRTSSASASG